MIWSIIELLWF